MTGGIVFGACPIERVDLLAQHRAFEGAAGFAFFFGRQAVGQDGVFEKMLSCFILVVLPGGLAIILSLVVGIKQPREEVGDVVTTQI